MPKPIDLAKRRRAAVTALLLSLVALAAVVTAAIAAPHMRTWILIPVFLVVFLLGGNLAGRTFGLFFGAAVKVVERNPIAAARLTTPDAFRQLGDAGREAGTAMRDALAAPKPPAEQCEHGGDPRKCN
ncbi:hypothetical protein H7J86_26120 [Mycobacterium hackensackense]|uniref:hypothetical protein n=1 Tax=Mycobacterium hackensackense TaxID=228909 RepID=UPI002265A085|nr:hypothetical protein [Mycobacterium hackensackense]MCV7255645.1 hypothetical protein [Mycobacterium hackensackense]